MGEKVERTFDSLSDASPSSQWFLSFLTLCRWSCFRFSMSRFRLSLSSSARKHEIVSPFFSHLVCRLLALEMFASILSLV